MSTELPGKVCVVTGAGSGIGRATALEMSARGAKVVVSDHDADTVADTAERVRGAGGAVEPVVADVTSTEQVEALMARAVEVYGRIDVLHNNAGVHETAFADATSSETLTEDAWDRVMDVNVKGTWRCARAAFPHLRSGGGGVILNSCSVVAFQAFPMGPAYCASKGAIMSLTRSMATDWAPYKIRVNSYAPGVIETPFLAGYFEAADDADAARDAMLSSHLIKRLGQAEDIAKVVCFLASDDASFITGSCYTVDGGLLAWRGAD